MLRGRGMSIAGLITGYMTVCIIPIAALAGLALPIVMKSKQKADQAECMRNMKMLGLSLFEFDTDYGSAPSAELAASVPEFSGLTGPRILEQLEVAGTLSDLDKLLAAKTSAPVDYWYYFPRPIQGSAPSDVLLVSPVVGEMRMTLRLDNSVTQLRSNAVLPVDLSTGIQIPVPAGR